MTDKLRKTYPLRITYADGEQPTAQKLNAISEQARNGSDIIERAVGDVWSQGGDTSLLNYPLQIPNIARMVGESKYLNPALWKPTNEFEYKEYLGTKFAGKTNGHLLFSKLVDPPSGHTGPAFVTRYVDEYSISGAGDYWVDLTTGRFRTIIPLTSADTLTYEVDPDSWPIQDEIRPGVIPDSRQSKFSGVRISQTGSDYFVHLPPRAKLSFSAGDQPSHYPPTTGDEYDANKTSVSSAPYKFFQDDTVNAIEHSHYRYRLPIELENISAGTEIPKGTIYLWDKANKTIIENVIFTKTSDSWILKVESSSYTFVPTADESESSYNTDLALIVVGTSLTRSIWSLSNAFYQHSHKNTLFETTISHNELTDTNPELSDPSYLPPWRTSNWDNDIHTSLLSRAGAQSSGTTRDPYNNAMLGHLLLANEDTSLNHNFLDGNCPDNSMSIYFGNLDGSQIYCDSSTGIRAIAKSGTDWHGLYAQADGDGAGIYGYSNLGYGVRGYSDSNNGVYGFAISNSGVYGATHSVSYYGVYGKGMGSSASTAGTGIKAEGGAGTNQVGGIGLISAGGDSSNNIGGIGIRASGGECTAGDYNGGTGLYAVGGQTPGGGSAIDGIGVHGVSVLNNGVYGQSGYGYGLYGYATHNSGIYGTTNHTSSYGIYGKGHDDTSTNAGTGIKAEGGDSNGHEGGIGLYSTGGDTDDDTAGNGIYAIGGTRISGGSSDVDGGNGIYAIGGDGTGAGQDGYGIYATSGDNCAVYGNATSNYGICGTTSSNAHAGIYGTSADSPGVEGISTNDYGVVGTGARHGVKGTSTSSSYAGVYGANTNGGNGVYGYSTQKYGVEAQGDPSSPAYAALLLDPQNADPTNEDKGALYVNDDTGRLSVADGTNWNKVVENVYTQIATSDTEHGWDGASAADAFNKKYTVKGNTLQVGSVIRIRAGVHKSTASVSNFIIGIHYGNTSGTSILLSQDTYSSASANIGDLIVDFFITTRAIGASPSFYVIGTATTRDGTTYNLVGVHNEGAATAGVNTASDQELYVTVQSQNSGIDYKLYNFVVDIS